MTLAIGERETLTRAYALGLIAECRALPLRERIAFKRRMRAELPSITDPIARRATMRALETLNAED